MPYTTEDEYSCVGDYIGSWTYDVLCNAIQQLTLNLSDEDFSNVEDIYKGQLKVEYKMDGNTGVQPAGTPEHIWGTMSFIILSNPEFKIASVSINAYLYSKFIEGDYAGDYILTNSATIYKHDGQNIGNISFKTLYDEQSHDLFTFWVNVAVQTGLITLNYKAGTTTPTTTTPTTTTSTTTPPTTTTTTPTTTTTTSTVTPIPPLVNVITYLFREINGEFQQIELTDGSDNDETKNTIVSNAFNFGTIAPGETGIILVSQLNVPNVKAIKNIKFALINTGGIEFSNNIFRIITNPELKSNVIPDAYFQGVNSTKDVNSVYNINIQKQDKYNSEYIYLNISLPSDSSMGAGVVRYIWFFEYDD